MFQIIKHEYCKKQTKHNHNQSNCKNSFFNIMTKNTEFAVYQKTLQEKVEPSVQDSVHSHTYNKQEEKYSKEQ